LNTRRVPGSTGLAEKVFFDNSQIVNRSKEYQTEGLAEDTDNDWFVLVTLPEQDWLMAQGSTQSNLIGQQQGRATGIKGHLSL